MESDGEAGAGVQRVLLSDPEAEERRLGPGTARGGQGRTHRRQRESTLCGDVPESGAMGAASTVRRTLLRTWGYGEPHQGAVQPVCRSRQRRDDEGGSDAAVLFDHGLRAGVRLASTGAEEHGTGAGASIDHSHAVAEDRRAGSRECAAGLPVDGGELPVGRAVRPSTCPVAGDAFARWLTGQSDFNYLFRYFLMKATGGALRRGGLLRVFSASFGPWEGSRATRHYTRCRGVYRFSASLRRDFSWPQSGTVNTVCVRNAG